MDLRSVDQGPTKKSSKDSKATDTFKGALKAGDCFFQCRGCETCTDDMEPIRQWILEHDYRGDPTKAFGAKKKRI